ncbi:MAG: tetratricopeptide repeat protein [Bacteroidales bacterium]|nr:tetratricopeptide repeat protein [Bacteroidales bacterium]
MKKWIVLLLAALLAGPTAFAQNGKTSQDLRTYTREGNKAYKKGLFDDAAAKYHLALKGDSAYYKAQYNLGNSLYRQQRYEDATQHFTNALQNPTLKGKQRGDAFHNLGNSHLQAGLQQRSKGASTQGMQQENDGGMTHFQQAVDNYKEALKLNPKNKDTKYNLSYAQKMLAQAQQNKGGGGTSQQQQGHDKQNSSGQGQNNQTQQPNQGDKGQQNKNQNQDNPNQQGDNTQPQNQNQQRKEQKKRDAEQLLGAVKNNEKNTMKEQQRAKEAKVDSKIEKDW